MLLPDVRSESHPTAPPWVEYEFVNQLEYMAWKQCLAAVVGYDDRDGTLVLLGTGTIIGSTLELYVATATHVLIGFANYYLGALTPNPFFGKDDLQLREQERLKTLLKERKFKVVVETMEFGPQRILDVRGAAGGEEMGADCALLQCEIPDESTLNDFHFAPAVMDFEHPTQDESLIMTGFVKPRGFEGKQWCKVSVNETEKIDMFRSNMVTRVSRIVEATTEPGRVKPGFMHWRVGMPSVDGMSGGPLIRLRGHRGRRPRSEGESITATTVGLVSRAAWDRPVNGSVEAEEHTWITAIETLPILTGPIQFVILNYHDIKKTIDKMPKRFDGITQVDLGKLLLEKQDKWKRRERAEKRRARSKQR